MLNVSALGLLLASPEPLLAGERLRVTFSLSGDPAEALTVEAEVRHGAWSGEGARWYAGCRFAQATSATIRSIRRFVRAQMG